MGPMKKFLGPHEKKKVFSWDPMKKKKVVTWDHMKQFSSLQVFSWGPMKTFFFLFMGSHEQTFFFF